MYTSLREAYGSTTFKVQLVVTMLVNFGVNFGIEYASMSALGTYPNTAAWPGIPAVRLDTVIGNCLALDMLVTAFAMGFFCTLLATGGAQREVRDKKCQMLAPQAYLQGYWLYTPVVLRDLCARSFAMGLYLAALAGAPTFLIMWASIGGGVMNGYSYTVFKGVWCMLVSAPLYAVIFPAAIDRRCFPELEFEELLQRVEAKGAPPQFGASDRYNAVEAAAAPTEATKFTAL